mgnify:CR=1 FL=1
MLNFLRHIRAAATGKINVELELRDMLKKLNCTYNLTEDEENHVKRYYFDFQSGNFVAAFYNEIGVEITYPNCFSVPAEEIELMRLNCNRFNGGSLFHRFFYNGNEEENTLSLHISFFCDNLQEHFVNLLKACFQVQRDFIDEYKKIRERDKEEGGPLDPEHRFAQDARELYLIRKQELTHQVNAPAAADADTESKLTLGEVISKLFPTDGIEYTTMSTIAGDVVSKTAGHKAISETELQSCLISVTDGKARFVADAAMLIVNYKNNLTNDPERTITIHLKAEGETSNSVFFRVTATLIPQEVSRANTLESHANRPLTISFLVQYSTASEKQRNQEFEYMWEDAKIKIRDGKYSELSNDQRLLAEIWQTNVAYNLYWGQMHLRNERYYQALLHFENAYNSMRSEVFEYNEAQRYNFSEICYYVGFCYSVLKNYEKAFFYLNLVSGTGKIRFATAIVNAMANSADVRTFSAIDGIMEEVKHEYNINLNNPDDEENEDIPEHIIHFVNFLRRRRIYAQIEFNMLNEAEDALTQMLNEPENADYAMEELAYINQLRIKQQNNKSDELPF